MALKYDYLVEVYDGSQWLETRFNSLTLKRSLYWNRPPTASLTLSNNRGAARILCAIARKIRITRNGVQEYYGIINTPDSAISSTKQFTLETRDYYADRLMNKQCCPEWVWDYEALDPRDLLRALIGTLAIFQERYKSYALIDPTTISNLSFIKESDKYGLVQLTGNGLTYQSTGSYTSATLVNNDWATNPMGIISSVDVTVLGISNLIITNLLSNPGFESDLTGWTPSGDDYDALHTDTSTADFDAGTKANVDSAGNEVKLTKTGTDLSYTETTQADFQSGTLTNVDALTGGTGVSGQLKLHDSTAGNQTHIDTTTADFNGGTYASTNASDTADQVQLNKSNTLGYLWRSQIPVNGSADGAQTNYQLKLTVNKTTGTNAAGIVYLQNKAQSWTGTVPNDIRFASNSDGSGLLDYAIESSDANTATVWVEVASVPSGGTSIYIFFGKASDTDGQNWDNTFIMADHFPGTSLNGRWTTNTANATVSGSIASLTATGALNTANNYGRGTAIRTRMYVNGLSDGANRGWGYFQDANFTLSPMYEFFTNYPANGNLECRAYDGTNSYSQYSGGSNGWHILDIKRKQSNNTDFIVDDGSTVTVGTGSTSSCGAGFGNNTANNVQVDWIVVRSMTTNEPSFGTPATEQALYATSGTWTSPSDSFNINSTIVSSVIDWNVTLNGQTLTVDTKVGASAWRLNVTKGGSIQDLTDNMGSTTIQVRANLSGNGTATPLLLDITKTVNLNSNFSSSGNRQKSISLASVGIVKTSTISWTSNVPGSTTLTMETSINGGGSWQACTSGGSIPGLAVGTDVSAVTLLIRESFTTSNATLSAALYDLTVGVTSAYYSTGSWQAPSLSLNNVGIASGSSVSWTPNVPGGTSLTVQTSIDGAVSWQTIASSGGAIPGIADGTDCTGKSVLVKATLTPNTALDTSPTLYDITVDVDSRQTEYAVIDTINPKTGAKCLNLACENYTSGTEYGVITTAYQTASAGQKVRAVFYTRGTADAIYLRVKAYNSSNTYLGQAELSLSNINEADYTLHTVDYTLPASTAKIKYDVKATGESSLYVDDTVEYIVADELKIEVSRDDGTTLYDANMYYNGSYWQGSYTFTGAETTKNKLKYKLTLYATDSNTKTPTVTQVLLKAATVSDTGVTEGLLEAWSNPLLESDTITYAFGTVKSRYEGIAKIQSITRQDIYADGTGALYCLNHRGSTLSKTFTVGPDIKVLKRRQEREPMANALQVLGGGLEDGNITLIPKSIYEDLPSIALYERIEKKFKAPGINDQEVLNAYTYSLLQRMKIPYEYIDSTIVDARVRDWSLGDTVTVVDGTQTTGQNGALRITDEDRAMSISGEEVSITFSTRDMSDETLIKEFTSQINDFMGLPQASAVLAYAPFHDDCDHDNPCILDLWLDMEAELKALDLSVWTSQFRSTSTGAASGGGSTSGDGGGQTSSSEGSHTHGVTIPSHDHAISLGNGSGSPVYHSSGGGSNLYVSGGGTAYTAGTTIGVVSSGGGSNHSHSVSNHTHSTPNHVHDLIYKIQKQTNAAAVKAYINDPTFSTPIGAFGTRGSATANGTFELINLSLLQYYDPDGSGIGKLGPGTNKVYLVPQTDPTNNPYGNLRIKANIRPKFKG